MSLAEAYAHCAEVARNEDRDRWLGVLFAPPQTRPHLHALIAFERELSRLRESVRDPMAGELRLAWWREALSRERDDEAQGHPIAAAVIDTLQKFRPPAHLIENAVTARQFDLYDDAFPTVVELEAYLGETRSGLLQIAAFVLADGRDLGELRFEHFAPLLAEIAEAPGSVDLLVVGLGEKMARLPAPLAQRLRGAKLRLEVMATGPASRVYNVLVGENRRVAALLLAAP